MASTGTSSRNAPLTIPDIVKEASNFDYNAAIPLKYWIRAADAIQKQAASYHRDGNDQDEYLFLMRHALLVTEKLSVHPDAKSPQALGAMKKANQNVLKNLQRLEILKPRIKRRVEEWGAVEKKRRVERDAWAKNNAARVSSGDISTQMGGLSLRDQRAPAFTDEIYGSKQELDPSLNYDLAARLARTELRKRASRRSTRDVGDDVGDLSSSIAAAGRRRQELMSRPEDRSPAYRQDTNQSATNYPSVPRKTMQPPSYNGSIPPYPTDTRPSAQLPPQRPPKVTDTYTNTSIPPQRPPKIDQNAPPLPSKVFADDITTEPPSRSQTATPDLKTSDYSIKSTASTESGQPLRTVYLPPNLRSTFLSYAAPNTASNLETCGILCGQLISNAFFLSHLIIPDQESTSDTCDTLNEEALFDYCDTHDLLTIGWIHTHPTQTCFMSSRDLHTHGGYQVQMAESVAIVCAPSKVPDWGVFRLTDPPGLQSILGCRKTGLFHPHDVENVYTDALRPGHVWELPGLEFGVVDLRGGPGGK